MTMSMLDAYARSSAEIVAGLAEPPRCNLLIERAKAYAAAARRRRLAAAAAAAAARRSWRST